MADHYEVVTQAPGFGSKLVESFKGILLGIVFFLGAFPLLWWGEGRQDLSKFIQEATLVSSETTPSQTAGTLIKTTGTIVSDAPVNDDKYLRPPTNATYLRLDRRVEMYAWRETKKTEKKGNQEVTTYNYTKDWTSSPTNASSFHDGANHANPPMHEQKAHFQVSDARIGALPFAADRAQFYGDRELVLNDSFKNPDAPFALQMEGNYLYVPLGVMPGAEATVRRVAAAPQIGDLRISYAYFPNNVPGSVVGDWDGQRIVPHVYQGSHTYLGAFAGTLAEFQAKLHGDYKTTTWIIRVGSFLLMWIGLQLILGPFLFLLEYIPIFGTVGRAVVSFFCGILAFVLWVLTLVLANLWLALLIFSLLVGGLLFYLKSKKPKPALPGPLVS